LLAEADQNGCSSSRVAVGGTSESLDTKQRPHHNDLCDVHHALAVDKEFQQIVISSNGHVNSSENQHLNSSDSRYVNSANNQHGNSANNQRANDESNRRLNSGHFHPVKLADFEHFLTDVQPWSNRPIRELGKCSRTADQLETEQVSVSSAQPITELGDCSDVHQLETERVDFCDIPARFHQNVVMWPSMPEGSKSLSTLCDSQTQSSSRAELSERLNKSAEIMQTSHNCVKSDGKNEVSVDSHSEVATASQLTVAASAAERPNNLNSSDIAQQLSHLSHQLAVQVTVIFYHSFAYSFDIQYSAV